MDAQGSPGGGRLPLDGLRVLDLSWGTAGAVTTMLLSDRGADVVKVEPPGGDPFRSDAGYTVWNRGKRSAVIDLQTAGGAAALQRLAREADVFVESFSPGTTSRLGIDEAALRRGNDALIYCSITGYGRSGSQRGRPGYDGLVQARLGLQSEQPGLRAGPVFLHTPLPSLGAALLASVGIRAALVARARMGRGQLVETSLAQGALLWTTQLWKRAEHPTPDLHELWRFKDFPPTPCYEAADGEWFHPMPDAVPVALAHVGRDPAEINPRHCASGSYEERRAYFEAVGDLYLQRPRDEWVSMLQAAGVPCQPVTPAEEAFTHPQVVHNGAVTTVDIPGVGPVTQFGAAFRLVGEGKPPAPSPPPAVGQHTEEVLARGWDPRPDVPRPPAIPARPEGGGGPLAGLRVLDFGAQLAGPFGPMILGDLGADVIKLDPVGGAVGQADSSTWVACQRGKRSILADLKSAEGQTIAADLIASADVLHYNLRTGVAERLGFGYEQAKAINPNIVFCHVTAYGSNGPLATWPGVDQMGQALCGHEYEQGATPSGGHPTWYRFGMCDAATGMLSVLGVLEALLSRPGVATRVEADILTAGLFMASNAVAGPAGVPRRPHLDAGQTGFGPAYRLYETADGWLCVAAVREGHWRALCQAAGAPSLLADPRFNDRASRQANAAALAAELEPVFKSRPAASWFAELDRRGVPCEVAAQDWGQRWYDDPDAVASGWVAAFEHPVWGRLEQAGRFLDFSLTPTRVAGAPPVRGMDTRGILGELGYDAATIEELHSRHVVDW